MKPAFILFAAYLVDLIVGDPRMLPHPTMFIGRCISRLEKVIRTFISSKHHLKTAGLLFPLMIVGGSFISVWLLLDVLAMIHPWLAWGIEVWLISTTLAIKGLGDAAMEIYRLLNDNKRGEARKALSMIVGRDTESLNEKDMTKATVETVAENIVDTIVSPLFYAAIGGAPLAMAYKAANTLDSMVGYKNKRYQYLGWASARFDDWLNYIPARITGILLVFIGGFLRKMESSRSQWRAWVDVRHIYRIIRRDAGHHPSPNSGIPEAGVAAVLGIQLGGVNVYQGVPSYRAKLGESDHPISPVHIIQSVKIMKGIALLYIFLILTGTLSLLVFRSFFKGCVLQ